MCCDTSYWVIICHASLRYRSFTTKRKIEFVKKSAGTEKRNREIGSFFSLCAMGALTGARPERAQIAGSGWQAYGEKGIYKCTFHDIENSATGGKK